MYLSNDFEGGETYFPKEALKVKPNRGSAILFRQSLEHSGLMVAKVEKYILRISLLINDLNIGLEKQIKISHYILKFQIARSSLLLTTISVERISPKYYLAKEYRIKFRILFK